jgi:hypothetical protein
MPAMTPRTSSPLARWLREGTRSAFFLAPRWRGLAPTPAVLFTLLALSLAVDAATQRLLIDGAARFHWPALFAGWLPTVVLLLACWWLAPQAQLDPQRAPGAAALFVLAVALAAVTYTLSAALVVVLARSGLLTGATWGGWGWTLAWLLPLAWLVAASARLLWRSGHGSPALRASAVIAFAAVTVLASSSDPLRLWYPDTSARDAAAQPRFQWTPALLEAQAQTLPRQIAALAPQRPGVVDVYVLTYAPYADEDVFLRESRMVLDVMAERFGAAGRALMLVNHRSTAQEAAWATPANLQRALAAIGARMDRDEDLLFIHLTSHGARSGELATAFAPLAVDALTPAQLKAALDAAGIRWRVISVSACYSGSWIAPLQSDHTLVMTAADAHNTSFGCGVGSELTFYGRAVFDEALRRDTRSFETALNSAREVIRERERQAGKDDGYSNPQLRAGAAIRTQLERLERERAAAAGD